MVPGAVRVLWATRGFRQRLGCQGRFPFLVTHVSRLGACSLLAEWKQAARTRGRVSLSEGDAGNASRYVRRVLVRSHAPSPAGREQGLTVLARPDRPKVSSYSSARGLEPDLVALHPSPAISRPGTCTAPVVPASPSPERN